MTSGAASLPDPDGGPAGPDLPALDRLRFALRPAELPLPHPRDVREAAHRVSDLIHSERFREARTLAEQFRDLPAPPVDRFLLLRTALRGALSAFEAEQAERDAADLVSLLHRGGYPAQAAATAAVLLERGPLDRRSRERRPAATTRAALDEAPRSATPDQREQAPRGRRRGAAPQAPPEMLVVIRTLEQSALPGPHGEGVDPRRAVARLRAALTALPTVRDLLLVDPERELRLRLAQALEMLDDGVGATTAALDVLELIEQEESESETGIGDPSRAATAAHAVLARTLGLQYPLQAVHHALAALDALHEIEDPPLRIGLITALLQALMAAGATAQASFTAGRLLSLQRTLGRDALRTAPLLAVAAQRLQAERYEAALVPLEQARTIARGLRDHRALLEVSRLAASIYERTGAHAESLRELRRLAFAARWLADDLDTSAAAQEPLIRTELEANALVMRRALDLGRTALVVEAVRAIERRTSQDRGRTPLPEELLWDHRVDARVGLFIAVGTALARGEDGVDEAEYERRRREAMETIDEMPAGHDARARYWAAYLDDRHAHLLAERGQRRPARRAARRAREGWAHLGQEEDVHRVDSLLEQLAAD